MRVDLALVLVALALGACERSRRFDADTWAAAVSAACGEDSSCLQERWRRDPRWWDLGLHAEVAGGTPQSLLRVETVRELASPERRGAGCLAGVVSAAGVYYGTWVAAHPSAEDPVAVFHWRSFDEAAAGHRAVVAAVGDAGGDERRLWRAVLRAPALDDACARFRNERNRCASKPATG